MPGSLKPTDKAIREYYAALREYGREQVTHEGALETALSLHSRTTPIPTIEPQQEFRIGEFHPRARTLRIAYIQF